MRTESTERRAERRLITGKREYVAAFDELVRGARQALQVFDPDGVQLGLNRAACAERLRTFLLAHRDNRLLIAVHSTDHLRKHCPRLMMLVSELSFAIAIHQTDGEATRAQDCFVLADAEHFVRRPVATAARGVYAIDAPHEAREIRGRFDEIWQSSFLAITATTLGL